MLNKKKIVAAISSSYNVGLGFGSVAPELQTRYFTTLSAAAAQSFVPESTLTLPIGDRAIEILFYTPLVDASPRFMLNSSAGTSISITNAGMFCRVNYIGFTIPLSNIVTGLNNVRVWRSQSLQTMYAQINGGTIYSVANTNNIPTNITVFGSSVSGIVAGIKLWTTTDFNSTPSYSWAIDSDGSTSTETATTGGIDLTRVNLTQSDTELYTLNESTVPVQWENSDRSVIIPVGY